VVVVVVVAADVGGGGGRERNEVVRKVSWESSATRIGPRPRGYIVALIVQYNHGQMA
jgi:hypothetical protein